MRNVCIHRTEMYTPVTVFQRGSHLVECPATTTVLKLLIISSLILCFINRACLENRTRRASMVPYCPIGIWPVQSPRRTKFQGTKEEWEFSSVKLKAGEAPYLLERTNAGTKASEATIPMPIRTCFQHRKEVTVL